MDREISIKLFQNPRLCFLCRLIFGMENDRVGHTHKLHVHALALPPSPYFAEKFDI